MKKGLIICTIIMFVFLFMFAFPMEVNGTNLDEYDIESADGYIDDNQFNVDFSDIVKEIYISDYSGEGIIDEVGAFFLEETRNCFKTVVVVLGVIIIGSVFKNVTEVFKDSSVIKTGFFVTYIAVMTLLFASFEEAFQIAKETTMQVMEFLYALIPTYFCAVTFAGGGISGSIIYQWTGLCVSLVQVMLRYILLPLANYYVIMMIINNATDDGKFASMCTMIKKVILYANRTMIGFIVGMTSIKSMTVPLTDSLKNTFLKKTLSIIPGVGNGVEGIAETIAGTGNLIKNSIGAAGLITIVLIVVLPFAKLITMNLMFHCLSALTEPMADKKIISGINAVADGIGVLQYVLCTSSMVMMIVIGIICMSTGG